MPAEPVRTIPFDPPAPGVIPPSATADAPLLLDYGGAARLLSISPRSVRAMVADGRLPCVRIGRSVRIAVADLAAFVERQRRG